MAVALSDWFVDEEDEETKHDLYTRRLVAWGWLRHDGQLPWEVGPLTQLTDLLRTYYIPALRNDLNRTHYGGPPWTANPEAPV